MNRRSRGREKTSETVIQKIFDALPVPCGEYRIEHEECGMKSGLVPGENVVAVSQEILSTGPVADITIEDVPLEDVIAELFQSR